MSTPARPRAQSEDVDPSSPRAERREAGSDARASTWSERGAGGHSWAEILEGFDDDASLSAFELEDDAELEGDVGDQLDRYPVVGSLGVGGMGQVLEVRDTGLGRRMAAKVIRGRQDPEALAQFLREARITGQLEHPNIVPVHQLGRTEDGRVYFTMKKIRGQSLEQQLDGLRASPAAPLPLAMLQVFLKVCDAMAFAHSQGVIHRDLKPANVMVGAFGEVMVCDWGLAKHVGGADASGRREAPALAPGDTPDGMILGTPAYMAPEQARGETARVDARADVYALGALLYEMLALRPPHEGATLTAVLQQAGEGALRAPSAVAPGRPIPWELEAVVLEAMRTDPEQRYPSAEALGADVIRFLEGRLISAARYSLRERALKWIRRNRALSIAIGVIVIALLSGLGLLQVKRWARIHFALQVAAQARAAGDIEGAMSRYERVLALDSEHAAAHAALRACRRELEQREIKRLVDHARDITPSDVALARMRSVWTARRAASDASLGPPPPAGTAERRARERALGGLLQAASILDHARSVSGRELPGLNALRQRVCRATGELALAGEDFTLARHAFDDLRRHGGDPAEVARWLARVEAEQRRESQRRWTRIAAVLKDLRAGLDRPGRDAALGDLDDAVFEVAGYRDLQTIRLLAEALDALTRRVEGGDAVHWTAHERALLRFLTTTLARLRMSEALAPLSRWSAVVRDPELAVEAGRALCTTRLAAAHAPLMALCRRLGVQSRAWLRIAPLARRVPEPPELARANLGSAEAHVRRGMMRLARGDHAAAVADFDRALALDSRCLPALVNRANAHIRRGAPEAAIRDATRALALQPDSLAALVNRSLAYVRTGAPRRAIADCNRALKLDPRSASAYTNRGMAYQATGDRRRALADYDRACALDPGAPVAFLDRAVLRIELGQHAGAIADCTRALALRPSYAKAYSNRGRAKAATGDLSGALSDLGRALELQPRLARAWYHRAQVHLKAKAPKRALADYDRAIALAPKRVSYRLFRARVRAELGDLNGAIADCDAVVGDAAGGAVVLEERGRYRALGRDLLGAERDYARALTLEPTRWRTWGRLGGLLASQRRRDEALAAYRKALAHCPPSARGEFEKAIARLK